MPRKPIGTEPMTIAQRQARARKASLLAERKRGMDDAIKAIENAYDKADRGDLSDLPIWEIRDTFTAAIATARDKLK